EEESRERRMFQERVRELRDARLATVEIPAEGMTARLFEHRLRPLKQLLMLQLFLAEADQRTQVGPVAVPVLLHDAGEVEGNELLVVAEQMHVAEGSTMVERTLLPLVQESEALGPHPRCGYQGPGRVEAAVAKDLVDGPRNPLRHCHDRRVVQSLGERIRYRFQRTTPSCMQILRVPPIRRMILRLWASLDHQVERGLGGAPDTRESGLTQNVGKASLAGLRSKGKTHLLRQR